MPNPGIYTVSITGQGQGFQFNNGGDRAKLMDIVQWGSISGSASDIFEGCSNLVGTAHDPLILQTTNLNSTFQQASKFNGYINNWDTSNVTNFNNLFNAYFGAMAFNQRLDNWNVEKVTTMFRMFWFNNTFNNNSISNWRPISCSNFGDTFYGSAYNHPINWPFSASNISMVAMFRGNNRFNQNIGSWDVSRVTNMNQMFYENSGFRNSGSSDINNWRPISCSNFSSMFQTSVFNQPIGNWPISASSINMSSMFRGSSFNQNIGAWDVSRVTNMGGMFQDNGGFNNSGSSDINNWRPISCSNFSSMFYNAPAFNQPIGSWPISASNISMGYMFAFASSFNQYIGSWDVSNVTSMTNMFNNADAFNQNIGAWNVEKVTNMSSMFNGNRDFNNSGSSDINNWRPISCSNFSSMFQSATAFNQPIGNWPLSASNINMSSMFQSATAFNQNIGTWDTSRVTNMFYMFLGANAFNQNIGSWNTSNVTNMHGMFEGVSSFNNGGSSDINNWNTSKVTSMVYMFYSTPFNQPVGNWNVSNVTNMNGMFFAATAFNQPLGDWNIVSASDMTSILDGTAIDIPNYTKTLRGWGNLANTTGVQTAVPLGASGKKYGAAHAQRKVLTDTYGWTITDGGQEPFVFTINTTASSYNPGTELTFQLPILDANTGSYALDILVNWGDSSTSTISSSTQPDITHTYLNSGSYEITITGSLTGFSFDNGGDKAKLTDVSKWSALEINTIRILRGCSNVTATSTDAPFVSTLFEAFRDCPNFNGNISSWDVSQVSVFQSCFLGASSFNQNIGNWDVSNATIMTSMFRSFVGHAFNQNLGSWNVSNVQYMDNMFSGNNSFNNSGSSDINNWNVGNVTSMEYMFEQSAVFNQPIGTWDVSSVTNMDGMFNIAIAFNQNISTWNTSKVTSMSSMFKDATAFNQNLGSWLIPSCSNMSLMLNNCGMDKANYSATLTGWASQAPNIQSNVTLGATGRQYDTPGSASRAILTSAPYNWNITGDTFVP
jgi:trimeric autotransporter adhesin